MIVMKLNAILVWLLVLAFVRCGDAAEVGEQLTRTGDEIMVCGKLFHTTAPVVLWTDEGGYDAYRVERRFSRLETAGWDDTVKELPEFRASGPARYGMRLEGLNDGEIEKIRGGGWPLP